MSLVDNFSLILFPPPGPRDLKHKNNPKDDSEAEMFGQRQVLLADSEPRFKFCLGNSYAMILAKLLSPFGTQASLSAGATLKTKGNLSGKHIKHSELCLNWWQMY